MMRYPTMREPVKEVLVAISMPQRSFPYCKDAKSIILNSGYNSQISTTSYQQEGGNFSAIQEKIQQIIKDPKSDMKFCDIGDNHYSEEQILSNGIRNFGFLSGLNGFEVWSQEYMNRTFRGPKDGAMDLNMLEPCSTWDDTRYFSHNTVMVIASITADRVFIVNSDKRAVALLDVWDEAERTPDEVTASGIKGLTWSKELSVEHYLHNKSILVPYLFGSEIQDLFVQDYDSSMEGGRAWISDTTEDVLWGSDHKRDAGNSLRRPDLETATEEERQHQLQYSKMYLARLRHWTTMSFTSEFGSFVDIE